MKFYKPPLAYTKVTGEKAAVENAGREKKVIEVAKVKDPVCGMELDPAEAKFSMEMGGETYYFCSSDCHEKFMKK